MVIKNGVIAAQNGKMIIDTTEFKTPELRGSVNIKYLNMEDIQIKAPLEKNKIKVINGYNLNSL